VYVSFLHNLMFSIVNISEDRTLMLQAVVSTRRTVSEGNNMHTVLVVVLLYNSASQTLSESV